MRRLAGLGILLIAVTFIPHAFAAPGSGTDATGDAPASLDIVNVTHNDSSSTITYTATLAGDPAGAPALQAMAWALNTDADATIEFCVGFRFPDLSQAAVLNEPCNPSLTDFEANASASRSGNTFTVSFPRSVLAGVASYGYTVVSQQTFGGAIDDTAGPFTHNLTAAPTATPADTDEPDDADDDDRTPLRASPSRSAASHQSSR